MEVKKMNRLNIYLYVEPCNGIRFGDLTSENKKQPLMVIHPLRLHLMYEQLLKGS